MKKSTDPRAAEVATLYNEGKVQHAPPPVDLVEGLSRLEQRVGMIEERLAQQLQVRIHPAPVFVHQGQTGPHRTAPVPGTYVQPDAALPPDYLPITSTTTHPEEVDE